MSYRFGKRTRKPEKKNKNSKKYNDDHEGRGQIKTGLGTVCVLFLLLWVVRGTCVTKVVCWYKEWWWWWCVQCVRGKNVAVCACDRGTYDCRRVGIASDAIAEGRAVVAAAVAAAFVCSTDDGDRTRPAIAEPTGTGSRRRRWRPQRWAEGDESAGCPLSPPP